MHRVELRGIPGLVGNRPGEAGDHQLLPTGGAVLLRQPLHKKPHLGTSIGKRNLVQPVVPVALEWHQEAEFHEPIDVRRVPEFGEVVQPGLFVLLLHGGGSAPQGLRFGFARPHREREREKSATAQDRPAPNCRCRGKHAHGQSPKFQGSLPPPPVCRTVPWRRLKEHMCIRSVALLPLIAIVSFVGLGSPAGIPPPPVRGTGCLRPTSRCPTKPPPW